MKKKSFVLAAAFMLALALTGCSASREGNTLEPSHSVTGNHGGAHETDDGNDAFEGGGAGGTNDLDNDGQPDASASPDGQSGSDSGVGRAVDDIGRGVGDVAHDAGDAVRDAGDAIGDAVNNVGRGIQ